MLRWQWLMCGVLVVALLLPASTGRAQPSARPLVVFVEGTDLRTASVLDPGPDGITELESIFQALGAETRWMSLENGPLPEETQVAVIVRPLVAMKIQHIAHLWLHLSRGNHLLLALDPVGSTEALGEGTRRVATENAKSSLLKLLFLGYGIQVQDTFLTDSWFSATSITNQNTTLNTVYAEDIVSHPVYMSLAQHELPVMTWGTRTMTIDPFGAGSYAFPLLYTNTGYGETELKVFRNDPEFPLELNLNRDHIGRLFAGALAENTRLDSRIVVLGDSELVQNGYGLARDSRSGEPLYLANRMLTERIAAWLLEIPVNEWPAPPAGYTWLAIDGDPAEWTPQQQIVTDDSGESMFAEYDIATLSGFRDDSYMYFMVDTVTQPAPAASRIVIGFENTFDGLTDVRLVLSPDGAALMLGEDTLVPVPDAAFATGTTLEFRVPLRLMGDGALISELCLSDSRTSLTAQPSDCLEQPPLLMSVVNTTAPSALMFTPGPRATINTTGTVNLRSGPSTGFDVLETIVDGTIYAATGRNADGSWLQLQNARFTGWVSSNFAITNFDVQSLPIIEG